MQNRKEITGITWWVLHCFIIASMTVVIKDASKSFGVVQIVFLYNLAAFVILLPFVINKNMGNILHTKKMKIHCARGAVGVVSLVMYFYAFTVIPLTQARAVALTEPLVTSIMAVLILKEKILNYKIIALLIGFTGALIVIRPGSASFNSAYLLVIGAVFMWGINSILVKNLSATESSVGQLFYLTGFMSLMSFPAALYYWKEVASFEQFAIIAVLGAIFLINSAAVFFAFKNANVTTIMPFDFLGLIFTAIIAFFTFDEIVDFYTIIGSVIIFASSVYLVHKENKAAKKIIKSSLESEI